MSYHITQNVFIKLAESRKVEIQTKANFRPIRQSSTHFITFHHPGGRRRPLRSGRHRQKSKPKPIGSRIRPNPGRVLIQMAPGPEIDAYIVIRSKVSMSASWFVIAAALAGSASALAAPKALASPGDPKLVSIHPFTGQRG